MSPPHEPAGPSENELLKSQLKVSDAKLEEARCKIEKYELTIEKLNKTLVALRNEEASLKRDYAQMCSQSDKYRLIKSVQEKDVQLADFSRQMKARNRVINAAQADKRDLKAKCEQLQAALHESQQNENEAWARLKDYQFALDETMKKEDQLKAILEDTQKTHHESITAASHSEDHLSRQLWELERVYDEVTSKQEAWS
ncbi:PREDICTED: myosin heavy chain, embryonic smooth muscle isoform-like [Lupinus angustifolius]|uniref:myosin heavy chain, embryonic smooth muscle isoform-like n=1 Tax=Lupinus angustifolius TaxID=3871 RepID=UPI00092F8663|nr:PREDICTED: myosin heavy chain, embryonic smooth muscle isoform-like [Lupinus angustifolius]